MKKTLLILFAVLGSSIASAGTLGSMSSSSISAEVEGLSSKDSFSIIEQTKSTGKFEQVARFEANSVRGEVGYRSMGCSTGCSTGCSVGCSVGCSSGCSYGCTRVPH